MEINGAQFTADPVSVSSALWRSSARSAAGVLLLLLTGRPGGAACAGGQGTRIQFGHGSSISARENDLFTTGGTENVRTRGGIVPGEGIHSCCHPTIVERELQGVHHAGSRGLECSREETARARKRGRWRPRPSLLVHRTLLSATSPRLDEAFGEGAGWRMAPVGCT